MVEFQRSSLKSCISSPRVLLSTVFPLTSKDFGHYYFGFSSFRDFAWSRALRGLSLFGLEGITSCLELQDLKVFAPSKAYVSRTLSWLHPAAESGNLLPALNPSPPLYLRGKKTSQVQPRASAQANYHFDRRPEYDMNLLQCYKVPTCSSSFVLCTDLRLVQQSATVLKMSLHQTLQLLDPHSWSILFKPAWAPYAPGFHEVNEAWLITAEPCSNHRPTCWATLSSGSLRFSQSKWRRTCPRQSAVAAANQCSLGVLPIIAWRCIILHLRFQTISSPGR